MCDIKDHVCYHDKEDIYGSISGYRSKASHFIARESNKRHALLDGTGNVLNNCGWIYDFISRLKINRPSGCTSSSILLFGGPPVTSRKRSVAEIGRHSLTKVSSVDVAIGLKAETTGKSQHRGDHRLLSPEISSHPGRKIATSRSLAGHWADEDRSRAHRRFFRCEGGDGGESRARAPAVADRRGLTRAGDEDGARGGRSRSREFAKCKGSHLNRTTARRRLASRGLPRLLLVGRSVGRSVGGRWKAGWSLACWSWLYLAITRRRRPKNNRGHDRVRSSPSAVHPLSSSRNPTDYRRLDCKF